MDTNCLLHEANVIIGLKNMLALLNSKNKTGKRSIGRVETSASFKMFSFKTHHYPSHHDYVTVKNIALTLRIKLRLL